MDQGLCRGSLKRDAETIVLFNIGEGQCLAQIPIGSAIVLDPQGNTGEYDVTIGPEWHPMGPKVRHGVMLPMGLGFILVSAFAGRSSLQIRRLGLKQVLFLLGVAVASGLVVYPVLHEGGHMVFGMLLGAAPDWQGVVWTCLSGQEPHASFSSLPQSAAPWMSAGGHILPTLAAVLLLLIWRLIRRNASWYLSAGLLLLLVLILFSTLGCLFELHQNTHMDALAVGLGLTGPLRVAFALGPLFVAVAAYIWLGRKLQTGLHHVQNLKRET